MFYNPSFIGTRATSAGDAGQEKMLLPCARQPKKGQMGMEPACNLLTLAHPLPWFVPDPFAAGSIGLSGGRGHESWRAQPAVLQQLCAGDPGCFYPHPALERIVVSQSQSMDWWTTLETEVIENSKQRNYFSEKLLDALEQLASLRGMELHCLYLPWIFLHN